MVYAILSDVHANVSALKAALDDAAAQGAEAVVSLGDAVGYGPQPSEAVALLRKASSVAIAGNHDDAVSGRLDAAAFNDLAGDAVVRHREALSRDDLAWLRALPHAAEIEGARLAHGDVTDPPKFYYVDDEHDATANFRSTDAALVFVGHTHVPVVFVTGASGRVYRTDPQDFTLEDGKRYIVNPGSVGYPREADGQCHSSYVLYDSAARTIVYRFLPFSVASVMQRGTAPRRRGVVALAGGVALVGLAAAGLWTWRTNSRAADAVAEAVTAVRTEGVVERRLVDLPGDRRLLKLNLELAKDSPPAEVKVAFLDANGSALDARTETVKHRHGRGLPAPKGAVSAEVTLRALRPDARPAVAAFEPCAVAAEKTGANRERKGK